MRKRIKASAAAPGRQASSAGPSCGQKPWMNHAGKLKHLHKEAERINQRIEEAFEKIEEETSSL